MLEEDGKDFSQRWGYLSRAGLNDKSQFTRQIEKYADIYTSRVANFLRYTPYAYFRHATSLLSRLSSFASSHPSIAHFERQQQCSQTIRTGQTMNAWLYFA
jgi:hypothetical protein